MPRILSEYIWTLKVLYWLFVHCNCLFIKTEKVKVQISELSHIRNAPPFCNFEIKWHLRHCPVVMYESYPNSWPCEEQHDSSALIYLCSNSDTKYTVCPHHDTSPVLFPLYLYIHWQIMKKFTQHLGSKMQLCQSMQVFFLSNHYIKFCTCTESNRKTIISVCKLFVSFRYSCNGVENEIHLLVDKRAPTGSDRGDSL